MSWELKTLDELGNIGRGRSRHRPRDAEHLYGGDYPFIQTGDVKHSGLYITNFTQTYSEAGLAQSKLWQAGTLCITIAANIADTAILGIDACFPDSIIGFTPYPEKADIRFVKYLFDAQLKQKLQQFTQGAAQDNLSQEKLLSIKFLVPEIPEQNKIADIISAYDDLIENNRRRIQLLERSLHLLYKEWFVHLRFPSHEHSKIVEGIPEGWQTGTVADFYKTSSGGTPSRKRPEFFTGEINWVKTQELNEGFIFSSDEKITEEAVKCSSTKIFPEETVLVAMYGATIGQTAILAVPAATNQACCGIIPNHPNAHYIHAFLFFRENKQGLMNLSQGSAQNNISQEIIKTYPMVLPTEMLMAQFVDYSKPVFRQIKNLSLQNRQLQQARDLLLPKLMSGAISV
jgi:type I restriction enzyme S subunit